MLAVWMKCWFGLHAIASPFSLFDCRALLSSDAT
jgi:hypothetical protein